MKRSYVVVGELENGIVDNYYAVCHSMQRADELCLIAEDEYDGDDLYYTWYEVIEEDDE